MVSQNQPVGKGMAKLIHERRPMQIGRRNKVVSTISLLGVSRKTARMRDRWKRSDAKVIPMTEKVWSLAGGLKHDGGVFVFEKR